MNLGSPRIAFQQMYSNGTILNVGSGEDPASFGDRAVHFDIDRWKHTRFVQGDAHNLPFASKSVSCVVIGDVLEHVLNPKKVLEEACRVAKDRVILTVFEDWELGEVGQHLEAVEAGEKRIQALGYKGKEDYHRQYEATRDKFISGFPESTMPHAFHINQFNDGEIIDLVSNLSLSPVIAVKAQEATHEGHTWYNWLILLGSKMKVSVLIPYCCLNGNTNLENCLDSLQKQYLRPYQIILCDDSPYEYRDSVKQVCAKYSTTYTELPPLENFAPQFSKKYNTMFPLVSGDMVLILCSNWKLGAGTLEKLGTLLERLGPKHMVASDVARTNMKDANGKEYDFFAGFPKIFPVWTSIRQAPPAQLVDEGFMNLMWRDDWTTWDEEFDKVGAWHAVVEWGHRLINENNVKLWIRRDIDAYHQERTPQPDWLRQTEESQKMLVSKVESLGSAE